MDYYAGIDVSLEESSVCVVDSDGKIIREAKVLSEPEALIAWFGGLDLDLARIGLEAGPLSQWLYAARRRPGILRPRAPARRLRPAAAVPEGRRQARRIGARDRRRRRGREPQPRLAASLQDGRAQGADGRRNPRRDPRSQTEDGGRVLRRGADRGQLGWFVSPVSTKTAPRSECSGACSPNGTTVPIPRRSPPWLRSAPFLNAG